MTAKHRAFALSVLVLALAGLAAAVHAYDPVAPPDRRSQEPLVSEPASELPAIFAGERFAYEFGWNGIPAADAEITVGLVRYNGVRCYHVVIDLRTKRHVDWIWRMRDHIESYLEVGSLRPHRFVFRQREGSFHHDTDVIFDHVNRRATSIRTYRGRVKTKTFDFGEGEIYDPLGALLVMRSTPLETGQDRTIRVFDGKRIHTIRWEVTAEDTIDIGSGPLLSRRILPRILRSDPPVRRRENSNTARVRKIFLWVGPPMASWVYRIESEVTVGRIYAQLIER